MLKKNGDEIYRGTKQEVDEFVARLKKMLGTDAEKYLLELSDLKFIDDAINKLNIKITVPKNTLSTVDSFKRMSKIYDTLRTMKGSNKFNPNKSKLIAKNKKVPLSKNGISADFANTPYLYPVKGNEKNIIKIKLTGSDYYDFKIANKLAGLGKKQPKGFTWHHLDDYDPVTNLCTMQLVETKIHRKCNPHYGGVEIVKQFFSNAKLYKSRANLKKIKL